MIEMYPTAVVLTNRHPFGGTDMMAQSLASALDANGHDTHIVSIDDVSFEKFASLVRDPRLALVMTTGTLPLQVTVGGTPVWRAVAPNVQFITYIVDAWPYDAVRVDACRAYLADWPTRPNLHLASLEANDARLIGPRAHYMPTGSYPAPRRRGPRRNPARLMVWASADKELAVTAVHDDFEATLAENDVWGLDARRVARAAEALRHADLVHGLSAIAAALELPLEAVVQPRALTAVCALDSCLKRHRRVKVVRALRGLPLDIYGENWQRHVGDVSSFRLLTPNPNHNHAFSHLVQHYAGLVNFDPNFGHGTNERAVSALALGVPIANNRNVRTDGRIGCIPYDFDDDSIRDAAERLLAYDGEVPLESGDSWEYLVGKLLADIAAEAEAGVAGTAAAPSAAERPRAAAVPSMEAVA